MTPMFILHHYESSPYAEKIRLLCGQGQLTWGSVLSPPVPPRPNVDPLSGGYRRIPIAQIGADIFCDTALIATEVATLANQPSLGPNSVTDDARGWVDRAQGDVFFTAITSVKPLKILGTLLSLMGPMGTLRFIRDRKGMMQNGSARPPQGRAALAVLQQFVRDLDQQLGKNDFLAGDSPGYADVAAYHPLWLHQRVGGQLPLATLPHLARWLEQLGRIGHGQRVELEASAAFEQARDAEPRPLPAAAEESANVGCRVAIAPTDYGCEPVVGTLVVQTAERYIIERSTDRFGTLHVHFPINGYAVTPQ